MSCTHSTDEEAEVGGLSALKLPWVPNTLRITIKFLQALPFSVQHPPPRSSSPPPENLTVHYSFRLQALHGPKCVSCPQPSSGKFLCILLNPTVCPSRKRGCSRVQELCPHRPPAPEQPLAVGLPHLPPQCLRSPSPSSYSGKLLRRRQGLRALTPHSPQLPVPTYRTPDLRVEG